MSTAKSGDIVRIHYTGTLTDGTQFDSSAGREPLGFRLGAGQIIPGLEREIAGMAVGEKKSATIAATDAYGPYNPGQVQEVPRSALPPEIQPETGMQLQATTADGQPVNLVVTAVAEESITVDGNHPLAGKDLVFEVELVEIVTEPDGAA